MRLRAFSALLVSILIVSSLAPVIPASQSKAEQLPANTGGPLPSEFLSNAFVQNRGQLKNNEILCYDMSGTVGFGRSSVFLYSLANDTGNVIKLEFPGSNRVVPACREPVGWKSNFFMGNTPEGWITGMDAYGEVVFRNLWDGIDLAYVLIDGQLKYEFRVGAGADRSSINIKASGHEDLFISEGGALTMDTGLGEEARIIDSALEIFYADGDMEQVPGSFKIRGDTYSFDFEPDTSRPYVIDPLIFSTYLGGTKFDYGRDIATDSLGNIYITGNTNSIDFPTTPGTFMPSYYGLGKLAFVTKLSPDGSSIIYSTFLGYAGQDYGEGIAVDEEGCAYITGYTSSLSFPTTLAAFDRSYNGDTADAFVSKLGPNGDQLVYSTFLGGLNMDNGYFIDVDSAGHAYVMGDTRSANYPTTYGALNRRFNGGEGAAGDAFVTKLSQDGRELVYSTYIGYTDYDTAAGIVVDEEGFAYIAGHTRSIGFATSAYAFDSSYNGEYDVFVMKLNREGDAFYFSTYFGGSSSDQASGIDVDGRGYVYVTGTTKSTDLPMTPDALDSTFNGWYDSFMAVFSPYGDSLGYSTFIGGTEGDWTTGIRLNSAGQPCLSGYTSSPDFPVSANAIDNDLNGTTDAFVMTIVPGLDMPMLSSFLGGAGTDQAQALCVDDDGFAIFVGDTMSVDFPCTPGVPGPAHAGENDLFVTKLDVSPPSIDTGPDLWINESTVARFDGSASIDNHGIVDYTWTFFDGLGNVTLYGPAPGHLFAVPGTYEVTLVASDPSGNWASGIMNITVLDITKPSTIAGPDMVVNEDSPVFFNGTASYDNVGIIGYNWTFVYNGLERSLKGPRPSFTFFIPGIYLINLNTTDAAGNFNNSQLQLTVLDITWPIARAGRNIRIYRYSTVEFNGTASRDNVGITSYTWTFNDGTGSIILSGPRPTHYFSVPGIYLVTLNVTDAAGHWHRAVTNVTVLEIVPPVAEAGQDMTVDEWEAATFDGSGSTDNVAVVEWRWDFFDGINNVTVFGMRPQWIFRIPGTYSITMTAFDAAGNSHSDTMTVVVRDASGPEALAGPNQAVQIGQIAYFNGTGSRDSSGIVSYTWEFMHNGTTMILEGASQSFRFWGPGTYTVTLTVVDGLGNTDSATTSVIVLEPEATGEVGIGLATYALGMGAAGVTLVAIFLWRRQEAVK